MPSVLLAGTSSHGVAAREAGKGLAGVCDLLVGGPPSPQGAGAWDSLRG